MKVVHFSCGNSSTGPIGFCAEIKAEDEASAAEILSAVLPEHVEVEVDDERVGHITVFFGPVVESEYKLADDIEEVTDEDGDE